MPRWNENRLTAKLGVDYPIIQGPLGGLSSQRLTAAVSNFGGLGSFGAHGLTPEAIKDVIAQIRSLTSKPFAMNLWVSMEDEGARTSDENAFNRSLGPLAVHIAALGAPRPKYEPYPWIRFEDQARILLDERVPVFSFIYGIPPREILEECRAKRIVTIGTATTPEEGAALQEAGVDAIVASGFEAGGHRGSFLRAAEDSLTGTLSLVPQIVDNVGVPVIAAGGIGDARGVVAALALGAEGVQVGTVFLACEESGASLLHRQALRGKKAGHTALTKGFTGRLARGIHNRLLQELNQEGTAILPYPLQRSLLRNLAIPAEAAGRSDLLPLWAGQSANLSTCTDVVAFLTSLVEKVSELAGPLIQWSAAAVKSKFLNKEKREMSNITDKVVVITGASSGIGESTAKLLAEQGARVVLGARRSNRIDAVVQEISAVGGKAIGFVTDVTKRAEVEALIQKAVDGFGRVDVLLNNAGIMPIAPIEALRVDEWDRQIDVNIKGLLYGVAAALPHMQKQKSGHIINITSVFGIKVFAPGGTVYCATKAAGRALTEGLRMELHSQNIRCTMISQVLLPQSSPRAARTKQPGR